MSEQEEIKGHNREGHSGSGILTETGYLHSSSIHQGRLGSVHFYHVGVGEEGKTSVVCSTYYTTTSVLLMSDVGTHL